MFDYVRLLNRSITERSIAFDWQNFFVSSITEPSRTQSSDWVRLGSISYAGSTTQRKWIFWIITKTAVTLDTWSEAFLDYGPEMSEYCQRKLDTILIHNFASLVDIVGRFYGNE